MVDQTQIGSRNGTPTTATRAVAHNTAELFADVITLGELQVQLFRCDWQAFLSRLIWPSVLLLAATVLLLSCVPVALVCVALVLIETTTLSPAQALGITLGVALVLGGAVALASAWFVRKGFHVWQRSQGELAQNVRWLKRMIQNLGQLAQRRPGRADPEF